MTKVEGILSWKALKMGLRFQRERERENRKKSVGRWREGKGEGVKVKERFLSPLFIPSLRLSLTKAMEIGEPLGYTVMLEGR